jgi:hypothetical protein
VDPWSAPRIFRSQNLQQRIDISAGHAVSPKQPVNPIQFWAPTLALEHRYLLPEGEDLDR